MRIAILGTGRVAQTLAAGLLRAGHDVVFGSHEPAKSQRAPRTRRRLGRCRRRRRRRARRGAGRRHDPPARRRSAPTTSTAPCSGTSPTQPIPTSRRDPGRQPRPPHPGGLPGRQGRQGSQPRRRGRGRRPEHAAGADDAVPLRRRHGREGLVSGLLVDLGWPARACSTSAESPTPTGRSTTWRCSERCCRRSAPRTSTSPSSRPRSGAVYARRAW